MRLQRVGRKHEPSFRLVLTDSKNSTKSGRFKEILGSYDPRKAADLLKTDRIKHWLAMGVSATGSVHNLLVTHKLIDAKKVNVLPKKTPIVKEAPVEIAPAPAAAPVAEASAPEIKEETRVEEAAPAPEVVEETQAPAPEVAETPVAEESAPIEEAPAPEETPAA